MSQLEAIFDRFAASQALFRAQDTADRITAASAMLERIARDNRERDRRYCEELGYASLVPSYFALKALAAEQLMACRINRQVLIRARRPHVAADLHWIDRAAQYRSLAQGKTAIRVTPGEAGTLYEVEL